MKNIERLNLELSHKSYFTENEYTVFLSENSLVSAEVYTKSDDELALLQTVIAILQALTNNIDLFRSIETEFATTSSAYTNLKYRIDELYKRIATIGMSTLCRTAFIRFAWRGYTKVDTRLRE